MYRTTGEQVPGERQLGLPGYPGGADTVGNNASDQFQLDGFGESLLLFAAADHHDRLEPDSWRAATIAANAIEARWHEPDGGIWELEPDEWTHSRLICAAGLRAISARPTAGASGAGWLALADRIVADTYAKRPSVRALAALADRPASRRGAAAPRNPWRDPSR